MRGLRLLVFLAVAAAAAVGLSVSVASATTVAGGTDANGNVIWIEVSVLGTDGDPGGDVAVDLGYVPYRWVRVNQGSEWVRRDGVYIDCPPVPVPNADDPALPPELEYGDVWVITMSHVETGEVVAVRYRCVYPDEDPPAPPPAPPTPGFVLSEIAPLLVLEPSHDPFVRGLTGLDTMLWCTGGSQVATDPIVAGGWTVTATAIRTAVSWDIEGPEAASLPGVGGCGRRAEPSAVWMPNVTGTYEITVSGTWMITYTAAYAEGDLNFSITVPIGITTVAGEPVRFDVIESPGVLID